MCRINTPTDAVDLALEMKNAAATIYDASRPGMTMEAADAVDAALRTMKRAAMRYRRELKCAVADAKRADKIEAARIAELDAENAKRLERYAGERIAA